MPVGRSLGKLGYDLCQHDVASGAGGPVSLAKCNSWDWNDEGGGTNDYKNTTKMSDFIFNNLQWFTPDLDDNNGRSQLTATQSDGLWRYASSDVFRYAGSNGGSIGCIFYNENATHGNIGFGLAAEGYWGGQDDVGGSRDGRGGRFYSPLSVFTDPQGADGNFDEGEEHCMTTITDWDQNGGDLEGKFLAPFYSIGTSNDKYKQYYNTATYGWRTWGDSEHNDDEAYEDYDVFPFCWAFTEKSPLLRNWSFEVSHRATSGGGGSPGTHSPTYALMTDELGTGYTENDNKYIACAHVTRANDFVGTQENGYAVQFAQLLYFEADGGDMDYSYNHGAVWGGFYKGLYNQYNHITGSQNDGWNGNHVTDGAGNILSPYYQAFGIEEIGPIPFDDAWTKSGGNKWYVDE